jgi:hypothetical protein
MMQSSLITRLSLVLALAAALIAAPADAQGRGQGRERAKQGEVRRDKGESKRPKLERRDRRDDDDRWEEDDDRWDDDERGERSRAGKGEPAFCRNGEGHPVFGRRWCDERAAGRDRGVYDGRYESRDGDYRRDTRYGSYAEEHQAFHRYLDRKYSSMAAERPLDVRWQLEVRSRKKEEHDRWHYQVGRRHE